MVDSIGSGGQIPKFQSSEGIQKTSDKKGAKSADGAQSASRSGDSVQISEEALSLANAQKAAEDIAAQISQDNTQTLSSDQERLSTLI